MEDDIEVLYEEMAAYLEDGDQIIVDGDLVTDTVFSDTADPDERVVVGYSHLSGDKVEYPLFATDYYKVWSV